MCYFITKKTTTRKLISGNSNIISKIRSTFTVNIRTRSNIISIALPIEATFAFPFFSNLTKLNWIYSYIYTSIFFSIGFLTVFHFANAIPFHLLVLLFLFLYFFFIFVSCTFSQCFSPYIMLFAYLISASNQMAQQRVTKHMTLHCNILHRYLLIVQNLSLIRSEKKKIQHTHINISNIAREVTVFYDQFL